MVLSVENLAVTYRSSGGDVPAVRGVSFDLAAGETLGVAGESGSGKSTLALALLRLLPTGTKVDGAVRFGGDDVLTLKPGRLRAVRWEGMSIVFQGAQHVLNPVRTVGEQIAEALAAHRRDDGGAAVKRLLELVGLQGRRRHDYPHELSGGQRQRAMIALAMACDPDVLIADEPTTALDVMVQAQVLQVLADVQRESKLSMLFITHDLSVLSTVADRIAVMYAGRIVEVGPAAALANSAHPYTQALFGAFPTIGDRASRFAPRGLIGDPPDPAALPTGCAFHPRCPRAEAACRDRDVQLESIGDGWSAACLKVEVRR